MYINIMAFFVVLAILSTANIVLANPICAHVFREQTFAEKITDGKFKLSLVGDNVFLLGVFNNFGKEWQAVRQQSGKFKDFDKHQFIVHAGSSVSKIKRLLSNPKSIQETFALSTSLINKEHRTTYGTYGFILSVPHENILAMKSSDMGTPLSKNFTEKDISTLEKDLSYPFLLASNPPIAPDTLLNQTQAGSYNEIMVAGQTPNGGKTEIVGLFLKTKEGKIVASDEIQRSLSELAMQLQLSIIHIEADHSRPY